ncbi:hypothetical protein EC07E033_08130 [Escherichia coli]|nr:hypothetical protein G920_04040 [Escherichia coli UMEA 3152-1]GEE59863.1 hypothetical protein EC142370_01405 [Escherichia coli O145:H34]GIP89938.1 hypothetical protein EC07E033_08130 [Escherichia coli]
MKFYGLNFQYGAQTTIISQKINAIDCDCWHPDMAVSA